VELLESDVQGGLIAEGAFDGGRVEGGHILIGDKKGEKRGGGSRQCDTQWVSYTMVLGIPL